MHVIKARNVNSAYVKGLALLRKEGVEKPSRVGEVLVMPCPVTTVYKWPQQRVLFDPNRDANPFFHLGEALWMLAGRNDATWLDRFVSDFSSRFAEDAGNQHGAYGYRWRRHFDMEGGGASNLPDQLETIIKLLRKDPDDRRVVLTMWDPVADLGADKRDICCNTHAYFRVREAELDITVCCRSNDAIWGAYGANAVHFSMLQEYIATRVGLEVGTYTHLSNNFHAYINVLDRVWPVNHTIWEDDKYLNEQVNFWPLVSDPVTFDKELNELLDGYTKGGRYRDFRNSFLNKVAAPMLFANQCWRAKNYDKAKSWLEAMPQKNDWRLAAQGWMNRRIERMPVIHVGDLEGGDRGRE